uniref:Uncharacterized protein n=1 Tax=Thermofilum adornatum TaxID=1365176 RepID=A0A7C1CEK3_9CREN
MFREMATAIILKEYTSKYTTLPSLALTRTFNPILAEKLRNMLGDTTEKIVKALEESLSSEIAQALNTKNIEKEFPTLAEKFWLRILLPLLELNQKITPLTSDKLKELIELEKEAARETAKLIRSTGYRYAEDLVYGLSAMVDYDEWLVEKLSQLGPETLFEKLWQRGLQETLWLSIYIRYLLFAWISATSALLKLLEEYREENRDTLAKWSRTYAEEVEAYIDTLDTLLDDEAYTVIEKMSELGKQA